MRRLGLALCALLWGAGLASAQITPTYTFGPSTTVTISRLNSNFTNGLADALDRTGGTITGNITVSAGITIDGIDIGATICTTCTPTFATVTTTGALTVGTSITAGSGSVQIVGTTGKIPAVTSTYFTSLDGSALTNITTLVIKNTTAVAVTDGSATDLQTGSLTAGALANNGEMVRITAILDLAANGNNKQVKLLFGSATVCDSAVQTSQGKVTFIAEVVRTGATAQLTSCRVFGQAESAAAFDFTTGLASAATETLSGAITIKTWGDGDAASDITSQVLLVEVVR